MKAELCHMNFQKLDFGEIDALDKFHNADVAVVDMSIHVQQASLFYHIGMRENMGMPETIILLNDTDPEFTLSVKVISSFLMIRTTVIAPMVDRQTDNRLMASFSRTT